MFSRLPPEVIDHIFDVSEFSNRALLRIALSSRSLLFPVRKILYHQLQICLCTYRHHVGYYGPVKSKLFSPEKLRSIILHPHLGTYVKKLQVGVYRFDLWQACKKKRGAIDEDQRIEYPEIFSLVPNVVDILLQTDEPYVMDDACEVCPEGVDIHLTEWSTWISKDVKIEKPFRHSYASFNTKATIDPEVILAASIHSLRTLALPHKSNLKFDNFRNLIQLTLNSSGRPLKFWQLLEMLATCSNITTFGLETSVDPEFFPQLVGAVESDHLLPSKLQALYFGSGTELRYQQLFTLVDKLPSYLSIRNLSLEHDEDRYMGVHDTLDMEWQIDLEVICMSKGIKFSEKQVYFGEY